MLRGMVKVCVCALLLCVGGVGMAQSPFAESMDRVLSQAPATTDPFYLQIAKNGTTIYTYSGPTSSAEKVTANTKYRIASASKWYVTAVMLQLREEGKISLNDKASKYLPSFRYDKKDMTIRHLLNHTSGLPTKSMFIRDKNLSLQESVDSIGRGEALNALPGAEFSYGSASFQVAARIAEVVTGKDWETVFQERIAKPCGMTNTDYGNTSVKDAGDGAYSTAHDFHLFLQMILNNGSINGNRVLQPASIKEMRQNQIGEIPISFTPYKLQSTQNSRYYGLGIWLDRMYLNQNQATEFSSQGGRGFTPWINTCKGITAVYSTYSSLDKVNPLIDSIKSVVNQFYPDDCDDWITEGTNIYPPTFVLEQNYPNPASLTTNISFTLEAASFVILRLFDPLGNLLKELQHGTLNAGEYNIPINTEALNPGVYFYRLQVNETSETKKLTVKK